MKIIVDGDACPAKGTILLVGQEQDIPVMIIVSISHWQEFTAGAQWITVDNLSQEVDLTVLNKMQRGDIVVTDDYGLASLVLAKGGAAISFRGRVYEDAKMDILLAQRHLGEKIRRGGGHFKGPKAYKKSDEVRLKENLGKLIVSFKKKLAKKKENI